MNTETEQIIHAIQSLKQESNLFTDYLFPIFSAFFASVLGAAAAYFSLKYHQYVEIEKEKLNVTNKWLLLAEEARSNLIAIKQNYHGKLENHPIQRAFSIPTILFIAVPIAEDYSKLSFLIPKTPSHTWPKWSQIPRIRTMIHNYNYLLELWRKRNEIERPIKEAIIYQFPAAINDTADPEQIMGYADKSNLMLLIDLTEHVIRLTDDLLIEFNDFLSNFPDYAETLINMKKLEQYGSVLSYSNNGNKKLIEIHAKSPEADYQPVTELFGMTIDQLKKRHTTGYENKTS